MNTTPTQLRKPPLTTCLILLCCALLFQSTTISAEELSVEAYEIQIAETEQRLAELDAEIAKNRALKKKLQSSVAQAENNVQERSKRIESLNQDIALYNDQLNGLEQKLSEEEKLMVYRKKVLAESLRKTQRVVSASGLKVVLQHDNPSTADRIGVYTDYFMRAQQQAISEQLLAIKKIDTARTEALKNRNWLNHIKSKAAKQHEAHLSTRNTQKKTLNQVEEQITHKTRTVAQLKADQERLQVLMEELKQAQIARSGYFLSNKGNYPMPVNGSIDARFGDIKSVGKIRWSGLFIRAKVGTPVRAIADGETIYSDWLQGFGMLVILDHGDGYMTLYGGNRKVAVSKGAWVESGATIATVGDSGGQKNSGLYFEVRQNAKPEDPEHWISTKDGNLTAKK